MPLVRAVLSATSIFLVLSAAIAQQAQTTNAVKQPPLFEGIMVDAKGNTVGRLYINDGFDFVVRQVAGTWVQVQVDVVAGFLNTDPSNITYWFQSFDCTGQGYFLVNQNAAPAATLPPIGTVATVAPSSEPSVYFAGSPAGYVTLGSYRNVGDTCHPQSSNSFYAGLAQSVPVSSLRLTLPFSVR